jgi:hypothetical protein
MNALVHNVLGKIFEEVENVLDLCLVGQTAQADAVLLCPAGDDVLREHRHLRDCGRDLSNERRFRGILLVSLGIHRAIENLKRENDKV